MCKEMSVLDIQNRRALLRSKFTDKDLRMLYLLEYKIDEFTGC